MSGINLDLLEESGKDSVVVCQTGWVAIQFSVMDACAG